MLKLAEPSPARLLYTVVRPPMLPSLRIAYNRELFGKKVPIRRLSFRTFWPARLDRWEME